MGTHPIFESDFDCLTEMEIHAPKSDKETLKCILPGCVNTAILRDLYCSGDCNLSFITQLFKARYNGKKRDDELDSA